MHHCRQDLGNRSSLTGFTLHARCVRPSAVKAQITLLDDAIVDITAINVLHYAGCKPRTT